LIGSKKERQLLDSMLIPVTNASMGDVYVTTPWLAMSSLT